MMQLYIRISKNSIAFAHEDEKKATLDFKSYAVNNAMSIAANLRVAFRETDILNKSSNTVKVLLDTPTLLIPLDDYIEEEAETQFYYVYPDMEKESVEVFVMPQLKCVALFCINKDLKMVLSDNFATVHLEPLMGSIWEQMHKKSEGKTNHALYCHFHGTHMDICSFRHNRFAFANTFEVHDIHDSVYFILGVWKQLGCQALKDDLIISGETDNKEALITELKQFLRRIVIE